MLIAGLDPSITHFGWVILDAEKGGKGSLVDKGVFKTSISDGMLVQRLILQRERLKNLIKEYKLEFVSMEAPVLGEYSSEMLFALNQFTHEAFLESSTFVIQLTPYNIKKKAYPEKNPEDITKNHMEHMAKKHLGLEGKNLSEHIADAYFAGIIGRRFYQWYFLKKVKDRDLTETEDKCFKAKHTFTRGFKKGITERTGIIYKENEKFFDFKKQKRKTKNIIKEVQNARKKSGV